MRLTPSWFRSSSEESTEPDDPDTDSGVTIYHTPSSEFADDDAVSQQPADFVPESNAALVATLEEMNTPVTVDEVADQLIQPARPPVETWAGVHERLHRQRLPELDAAGDIVFDESQGIVERPPATRAGAQNDVAVATAASRTAPVGPFFVFLALLSVLLLGTAVVVAMTVVV